MDPQTIDDTIYSIKTALEIANSLKDLKVNPVLSDRISQLTMAQLESLNNAMHAKFFQLEQQETINKLQAETDLVKKWETQKRRYALISISGTMAMVYAYKDNHRKDMPPHWICTNCYKNGSRSILQPAWRSTGNTWILLCPSCKTEIDTGLETQRIPEYAF